MRKAITRQLAESDNELWLLNRGNRKVEKTFSY